MIPVLSPADVKAIDEQALKTESLEDILDRVGSAVSHQAVDMLRRSRNRQVVALVGPGLNGADARAAAIHLEEQGITVDLVEVANAPTQLPACDLIIDGAFGIGLNKPWTAPGTGTTPVLSIDIPSGIHGLTGEALGSPIVATRTVTFIGYKSGLLFGDGPEHCGEVRVFDIGLPAGATSTGVIEAPDVRSWLPRRGRNAHKWHSALLVVAGSDGMTGAAKLACAAAMRAGAGYVHLDTPAASVPGLLDVVVGSFAGSGVRAETEKFRAAVVGPGLSRVTTAQKLVRTVLSVLDVPVVVDGDGLAAVAAVPEVLVDRPAEARAVLTPHDGEFERLTGNPPGVDRIARRPITCARSQRCRAAQGCHDGDRRPERRSSHQHNRRRAVGHGRNRRCARRDHRSAARSGRRTLRRGGCRCVSPRRCGPTRASSRPHCVGSDRPDSLGTWRHLRPACDKRR